MIAILEKSGIVKELRAQNERIEAKVCEIVAENERLRAIEVAAQVVVKCEFKDIDSCVDAKEAASLFMLAHALANRAEPKDREHQWSSLTHQGECLNCGMSNMANSTPENRYCTRLSESEPKPEDDRN